MKSPTLENNRVKLSLIDLSNYEQLQTIAQEKDLIHYSPSDISTPDKLRDYVQLAVDGYYHKTIIPFIVYDKQKQVYAGSTRFGLINWKNKVLHIGWTWIGHEFQGTGLNKNMKFLMMQYAFETLEFEKVEFRIDERNLKSRRAVEKIGGTLEGILRKDTIMKDGFRRSTCCYGILLDEWRNTKQNLLKTLNN
ncbi:GNAT family N-acetyltransferase [Winogradskyella sp. PC-19]|uniref:GNAT family N-acetyltransferase n=1 Tax=unclassified Winogradskyella TaxID=2615021 RepID=UPI000B3C9E47|nr:MULTISPECIES: GNAT family protein [unclassified Winogradskyella]ARV08780.1 GNAT family N-acetyltransferase [Winogradskyella sp. PC-19]RZN77885.1 MAG: N-acetyltransferase [Winogradskyella sp.]